MASVPVCLLVVLMAVSAQTDTTDSTPGSSTTADPSSPSATTPTSTTPTTPEPQCPNIGTVKKNNWAEDQDGMITSEAATGVTGVSWAPYNTSSDFIDVSGYVDVTYNKATQEIVFTALPAISGARDFPAKGYPQQDQLGGYCQMTCGSNTGKFQFLLTVNDKNTATPAFASSSYSVGVLETFPENLTIPNLLISASDADAETTNNKLSFTLKGDNTFGLTQATSYPPTSDQPATYTVQLVLKQQLNWSRNASYQLTVVANDPGGLSAETTVSVTVIDVDTMQPEFDQSVYSATIDDPETPIGPVNVSIKAVDPDSPGTLVYTMEDTSNGGQFDDYFTLDPTTAELAIAKDITDILQQGIRTLTYLLTAMEDAGNKFTCRAALVIHLPEMMTTTTEPSTSTTPMTSIEPSSSTTLDTSTTDLPSSTSSSTSTEPTATAPSSTTDMTSTHVTSPTSTDITATTSTSTDTTVTSPVTSPSTPVTSGAPTSTPVPTPTPAPPPCPLFPQRQYLAEKLETYTGEVVTVTADSTAEGVTYFLRTPGYEDSFALDEATGELTKLKKLGYQRVSLLVQAIPGGGSKKNQTTDVDIVDWDETLIIIDITDENDSPPVPDCSAYYASSCDSVSIGFPASETATLPAPLLRLTATDGDTGDFGVAGMRYTVDSPALQIDSSGMLYLVKQQGTAFNASVTIQDNNGKEPANSATATITLVPVHDDQVFFVRTTRQLTDAASVTSLLQIIAQSGSYLAVFSLDFQPLRAADPALARRRLSDDTGESTIYIYALRQDNDEAIAVVESDDIKQSLDSVDNVEYIETKDDQMSGGGGGGSGGESSDTGLIVAVAVLACLLVAVIVAAVFRQRQLLRRSAGSYARQKDDAESYGKGVTNANYSSATSRPESAAATYSNRSFQHSEKPVSSAPVSGSESVSRSAVHQSRDEEQPYVPPAPRPSTPPVPPTATLIDIDEPEPTKLEPELEPEPAEQDSEPVPTPEEPTPDYSLKSVGFKETVICVSPPMEPHEEEEEEGEKDDEEEHEYGESDDDEAGEEKAETGDISEPTSAPDGLRQASDGDSNNGENSML